MDEEFDVVLYRLPYWRRHRLAWAKAAAEDYFGFLVLAVRLLRGVEDKALRAKYRQQLLRVLRMRAFEPQILFVYAVKTAMHYHYAAITGALGQTGGALDAVPDGMRSFSATSRAAEMTHF